MDHGEEQVILCHTDSVLREWLHHLRGLSALDTREASAERAGNQNDRSVYEYGTPFLREDSGLCGGDPLDACVVWGSCSYRPHRNSSGLAFRNL
jgi:hypothetical protein